MDHRAKAAAAREIADVDEVIGANLKRFRQQRGVTQSALGDEVGVTFQQIFKYESGETPIAASRLRACAIVLQVPIEELYAGLDGIADEPLERHELALVNRAAGELAALPEPFRSSTIAFIQSLRRTVVELAADAAFRGLA